MSLTPFDLSVAAMLAQGIPRDKAERAAREQLHLTPAPDPDATRRDRVLEKAEQAEVVSRFRVCGFDAFILSQARATKQTPGLPDLWLMNPARHVALWWEAKRQVGGRFSQAQLDFAAASTRCGILCGAGDRFAAQDWLVTHGLAEIVDGQFIPVSRKLP